MSENVGGANGEGSSSWRLFAGAGLIFFGVALLGWAAWSILRAPPPPYEFSVEPTPAAPLNDFPGAGIAKLKRIEIREPGGKRAIASGLVTMEAGRRATPLSWRNAVTEPVFFADLDPADSAKALTAIRDHVGPGAVVFAWWDMSRRIRAAAQRDAPLDDPQARGLLTPAAWSADAERVVQKQQAFWGAGASAAEGLAFGRFIDALLSQETQGAEALRALANGKEAFLVLRLSDIWKAATARPESLEIAYKDFAAADAHDVMKAARQWMQEIGVEGGFAVEPMGAATRLHYLPRAQNASLLLARLLPFSTSNPLALENFELVFQHKDCWIYRLKPRA